jgi:CBS domain-containing protein
LTPINSRHRDRGHADRAFEAQYVERRPKSLVRSCEHEKEDRTMHPSAARSGAMYRFLECVVGQYMAPDVMTVTRKVSMRELGALFEKHDFNAFPVVEDGNLLGLVTKFDFLRAFAFTTGQVVPHYDELMERTAGQIMTEAVVNVEPAAPLTRVLQLMVSLKARSFPVTSPDRRLVGMIAREDIIRALKESAREA